MPDMCKQRPCFVMAVLATLAGAGVMSFMTAPFLMEGISVTELFGRYARQQEQHSNVTEAEALGLAPGTSKSEASGRAFDQDAAIQSGLLVADGGASGASEAARKPAAKAKKFASISAVLAKRVDYPQPSWLHRVNSKWGSYEGKVRDFFKKSPCKPIAADCEAHDALLHVPWGKEAGVVLELGGTRGDAGILRRHGSWQASSASNES
eukprot:TRINITY_DN19954_c0_g1_i2.p1 TRINITY_DN19954_c0_g1~~TRINITY_DN19954_c0_g1_i2.p1  ORF type:complete len:208 (+),score=27.01 TRINITY_DN19954_c0_g1_i2:100-723(+)